MAESLEFGAGGLVGLVKFSGFWGDFWTTEGFGL